MLILASCGGDKVDCETFPRTYAASSQPKIEGLNKYEFINSQFIQTTGNLSEFSNRTGVTEVDLLNRFENEILQFTLDNESSGSVTNASNGRSDANILRVQGNFINVSTTVNYTERIEELDDCNQLNRCIYAIYFVGANSEFNEMYSHCNITSIADILNSIRQFQRPASGDVIFVIRIEQTLEVE